MDGKRLLVKICVGVWAAELAVFLLLFWSILPFRATILLTIGAFLLWVVLAGGLMYALRNVIRPVVRLIPLPWQVTFVLFCTTLIMLEEFIAVSMTNLAPMVGSTMQEAYLTASASYWDVVLLHSVVVIVPMFVVWAWLLTRYDFKPFQVFVLFGITGWIAEIIFGGLKIVPELPQWIMIYGLMVWLPAYCIPQERGALPVRWWHFALAILLAILSTALTAGPLELLFPDHPRIHFPPRTF